MKLDDFEIEDLDAEDIEQEGLTSKVSDSGKTGKNALRVVAIIGINITAILLVIVILGVTGFIKGKIKFADSGVTTADKPIYTEGEMQQLVLAAQEDATALKDTEVANAYNNGYSIGSNSLLEYIRENLISNNSSLETFNLIYPDYTVVVSNGRYNFVPINTNLALSNLVQDRLNVLDSGEMQYLNADGSVASYKGIDVSEYQGNINWAKVADDGVEFAIMRAYYRGYGTGRLVRDAKIDDNLKGAIDNGIHVGVYVFSQAITLEEAVEEAQMAIDTLAPYATNVPIVIDVERVAGANPRMDALTVEERTDVILAFCDTVTNAGYIPMIYYNTEMGALLVDLERLEGISKWYAWYGTWLYLPYEYDIWQYKDTGKVDGISGSVDMNIALKPFW